MNSTICTVVFLFFATCISSTTLAEQILYGAPISLQMAKKVAASAETEAKKNNFTMVIAIVDAGGNLVYLEKIDGTQLASVDVAIRKARSANDFKRPTKVFENSLAGGRMAVLGLPGALPLEGGVPILLDGKIIGAIGVSGGTSSEDGQVAAAGVSVLQTK